MLTYTALDAITNELLEMFETYDAVLIFTAGDLYEDIAPFTCALTQLTDGEKLSFSQYKNSWVLRGGAKRVEFYDLADHSHIELFQSRYLGVYSSGSFIDVVFTFELEGNTLVWEAMNFKVLPILSLSQNEIPVSRRIINV